MSAKLIFALWSGRYTVNPAGTPSIRVLSSWPTPVWHLSAGKDEAA